MKKNVAFCAENNLCCSCGFCADICPVKAIKIFEKHNVFVPSVDKNKCTNCGLCLTVCSGKGCNWYEQVQSISEDENWSDRFNDDVGYYRNCYVAHSENYDLRFHAASGGVVTTILLHLIREHKISGAVVTRFKADNPLEVETFIARNEYELLLGKSSKYCPVHMDGIIEQLKSFSGKVAFVGLPCHIQSVRNIERKFPWLKEKIFIHLGLYCSGGRDTRALSYLLKKNGMSIVGLRRFAFRDDGCLGNVIAVYDEKTISVPFVEAYSVMHSFFKPERCVQCLDHFAYLADISLDNM